MEMLHEIATLQHARRAIALDGFGQLLAECLYIALPCRDANPNGGFAVELASCKLEVERHGRPVAQQAIDLQGVIRPFALQAGKQGPLQCALRLLVESIHQGLAVHRRGIRVAEQLEPGGIHIDDDPLLDLGDRISGACHEGLQLLPGFPCGCQRRIEGTLKAEGAQFAGDDRLQSLAMGEGHHVACTVLHGPRDRIFIDLFARENDWHFGRALVAHVHDRGEFCRVVADYGNEHLGVDLSECVGQVMEVADPAAVHGVARIAKRAVNDFDVVLRPRQDNHRYRTLLRQFTLPQRWLPDAFAARSEWYMRPSGRLRDRRLG